MRLEAIHSPSHDDARCPTCGGGVRERVYGEMHAGSFVLDGKRMEISGEPPAGFADPIVLDELTQYFSGSLYRLWPGENYYSKGGSRLHRDVWKLAFGLIPKGCHIHHRDSNALNNRLANLECMDAKEHLSLSWHSQERTEHFSQDARDRAADWHGSEAGRLWHSRHAVRSKAWTKWKREPRPCPQCSKEFDCLIRAGGHTQKYCSPNCKVAAYRARGADARATARYREREKAKRDI